MKERKQERRKRIQRLFQIGFRSKEISQIIGISPRTVRYYLQGKHTRKLPLRQKANLQDRAWIEKLGQFGASKEEISDILMLNGRVIFKCLKEEKVQ